MDPKVLREEGRKVFGPPTTGAEQQPSAGNDAWSIVLAVFRGDSAQADAEALLAQIRTRGQLPEAVIQVRGRDRFIVIGSFTDPASPEAQAELKRIHDLRIDGNASYAAAFLVPPPDGPVKGSIPEFDLRNARARYGDAAKYTLEIGFYGRPDAAKPSGPDLAEFRAKAEEAAAKLRQAGELAFYFHGPSKSSVTVGLFDDTDFDPQAPGWRSPRLAETRRLHPHHLFNGQPYRVKGRGVEKEGFVAARLVPVPKDDAPASPGPPVRPRSPGAPPPR
jgi:hypothetical protein